MRKITLYMIVFNTNKQEADEKKGTLYQCQL